VTTTQVSRDVRTNPLGEIFAGLVIIIASIYVIAPLFADLPVISAAYGVTLAAIARHMWKHGSPRSLPLLCVSFAVTAVALSILGAIT
jgi:predicted PurR-regulated permease PerM